MQPFSLSSLPYFGSKVMLKVNPFLGSILGNHSYLFRSIYSRLVAKETFHLLSINFHI
jgi:hypothetical protein